MSTALIVFAKVPAAGVAKTRLAPALGVAGAAALAERLLAHAVAQAMAAAVRLDATVELCLTPDEATHPALAALFAAHPHLLRTPQGAGDLGQRMARAFERALQRHRHVLLLGTDAPALDATHLAEAAAALRTHEAVFVPALDGGYALVGLNQPAPALFENMTWSHRDVMSNTRERARAAGLRFAELAPVADIDEPADLVRLPAGWLRTGGPAGH
jgi:rSAM/selenodomain-associated transferase 1